MQMMTLSSKREHLPPLQTFDEANLCESLRTTVSKSGYVKPTPVQKHGIPIISAGRDLMACAQTGSGKTVRAAGHPQLMCSFACGRRLIASLWFPPRSPGGVSAPHPSAAHGGRRRRQFFQRAAGTRSHHCRSDKGAHQPDLPGGPEVRLRVYFTVSVNTPHTLQLSNRSVLLAVAGRACAPSWCMAESAPATK